MHMQSSTATCSYGFANQASYFFDRRRASARQEHFARGRVGMLKRRHRDDEAPAADAAQKLHRAGGLAYDPQSNRFVLDRLKRMRLASPPTSPPADESAADDSAAMADASMEPQAIIPLLGRQDQQPQCQATLRPVAGAWRPLSDAGPFPAGYQMPPADETCTALVLFNPTMQPRSLTSSPRVELVESDEDDDAASSKAHSPTSDEEHQSFVRFEEIPDDEDEPMDID